jgi:UDP-N-acetylglucosamine 2-epimerase (non-hydrolysing)
MSPPRKVMVVFGTRPEAIKLAPLVLALQRDKSFRPVVTVTAQHREMLDQVLELFGITPDFDLDVLTPRQTLIGLTVRILGPLGDVIEAERPDAVVVQGDTTTTFVGALAAFYHHIPVVHLEAGLRTGDAGRPFPEEANRRLTTQLSSLHLAPTACARGNLLREAVPPWRIVVTGNTGIDALRWACDQPVASHPLIDLLRTERRRVVMVTSHRRESWGAPLVAMAQGLAEIAISRQDIVVVFPLHRNPIVRDCVTPTLGPLPNVLLVEPLPYGVFVRLMERADLIVTDSGGIQEEGPSLGKPVLVTRDVTERPEAVAAGTARLVGTNPERLSAAVTGLLDDPAEYRAMATAVNPYGDGHAARRAVAALKHFFGAGPPSDEFVPLVWKEPAYGHEVAIPPSMEDLDGVRPLGAVAAVAEPGSG